MKQKVPYKQIEQSLSQMSLNRIAKEYGCTPANLIRVLRKSKRSRKLTDWLHINHPQIINAFAE